MAGAVGIILLLIGTTITIIPALPKNKIASSETPNSIINEDDINVANNDNNNNISQAMGTNAKSNNNDQIEMFDGPLGNLLPDLSLLPEGLSLWKSGEITDDDVLNWSVDKIEARQLYVDNSDYTSLIHIYGNGRCKKQINTVILTVEKVASQPEAEKLFEFVAEQRRKRSETVNFKTIDSNSHESNESITCEYAGKHTSIVSGRTIKVKNVLLGAGVIYPVNSVEEYEVDQILDRLTSSMIARLERY